MSCVGGDASRLVIVVGDNLRWCNFNSSFCYKTFFPQDQGGTRRWFNFFQRNWIDNIETESVVEYIYIKEYLRFINNFVLCANHCKKLDHFFCWVHYCQVQVSTKNISEKIVPKRKKRPSVYKWIMLSSDKRAINNLNCLLLKWNWLWWTFF